MNALYIVHEIVKKYTPKGGVAVDATAGRGYDTAFLCDVVGGDGKVYAFDIQQSAIDSTKQLLDSQDKKATLILDSHANMDKKQTAKTIVEKKAEAIKEAKKNRVVLFVVSCILLLLSGTMVEFGIDCLIHADKITGGILLGAGLALLISVVVLMTFTYEKIKALLSRLNSIEEITAEDIEAVENEGAVKVTEEPVTDSVEDDETADSQSAKESEE